MPGGVKDPVVKEWHGRSRVHVYPVSELVSELLRHRHTVEQYGVRVEIPTKAHRISHSSARSYHTWHARGHVLSRLSDSGGCPNARRLYARSPLPGENCQPPCGRDRNQAAAHGPLSGCKGPCAGDWPATHR